MSQVTIVYAVFGGREEAETVARAMVERRLAACANVLAPCRSFFRWEGAIEEAEEVPAIFKVSADGAEALIEAIAAMHGYDTPPISSWQAGHVWRPYAEWVERECE